MVEQTIHINTLPAPTYLHFTREQWAQYRLNMPLLLTEEDLDRLHGQNEMVSLQEIEEIYLPLSRLMNLYVVAMGSLYRVTSEFLGTPEPRVPYIIGIAGSVAVGKSTTSRVLQALLSSWPDHPRVDIVTTDGFLYSNAELERRGLMNRKGFPESYDMPRLIQFMRDIKSGKDQVYAPLYSHHEYDIVKGECMMIKRPDIVIIEGLNILQTGMQKPGRQPRVFVSDFLDFSIFVDAEIPTVRKWYVDRVLSFCDGSFKDPASYFHYLSKLTPEEITKFAERIWREINEVNLLENILPFKNRARLILWKANDHSVQKIYLRKL